MTKVLLNRLKRCHRVLFPQSMWSKGPGMIKIPFNHLERCHRVLISPKYVV